MRFDLQRLVRPKIRDLRPYSSARSEFSSSADIFLDANENSFGSPAGLDLNRYPDPLQAELKKEIAELKKISADNIFVGNGSDEAIDLLIRIFCEPGRDNLIVCPPTYGMYTVSAAVNDIAVVSVPLTSDFQLRPDAVLASATPKTKIVFLCSPNNPTGNLMRLDSIIDIAEGIEGVAIVDEAYIDFADTPSLIDEIGRLPNLVVLQTLSKAWGLAGARLGIAFASSEVIGLLTKVKPPYNVGSLAQRAALAALTCKDEVDSWRAAIVSERSRLADRLAAITGVDFVHPSDANFLLVKFERADALYQSLIAKGIVVRDRSKLELCSGCLRITVGTPGENARLLSAIAEFYSNSEAEAVAPRSGKNL